jgi:D-alanyl-lipoteichoic acid acyltransferase DltB (MBOAT superfamily)
MVFSSVAFLTFFLPGLLIVYFATPKRFTGVRNAVLLVFSLAFYGFGGPKFLLLMLLSIAVNYVCGLLAGSSAKRGRRFAVCAAAVTGLGLLAYFKYAGFFAEILVSLGAGIPVPAVALPIGISFFTFQGLSYVIDVYRGDAEAQKNPANVALYIALFPQLVAGPIVRYTTVAREIREREVSLGDFSGGVIRFLFGFAKKMLLANAMGEIADKIFGLSPAGLPASLAWTGAIAYTFQIYFDFSAYSDMAIGLGRMFGFRFLENFNYPYISKSITEFWRRWHISLSTWFRDYVYIPLGGSRRSAGRHIFNIFLVWLLTGFWHGAAWNFIVWGLYFCALLLGEKYLWRGFLEKAPAAALHIYTLVLVILSWVIFRAPDMQAAAGYIAALFGAYGGDAYRLGAVYYIREYLPEFAACVLASLPVRDLLRKRLERGGARGLSGALLVWGPKLSAALLFAAAYMKLVSGSFNPFIYFKF